VNNTNYSHLSVDLVQACLLLMLAHRFRLTLAPCGWATVDGGGMGLI